MLSDFSRPTRELCCVVFHLDPEMIFLLPKMLMLSLWIKNTDFSPAGYNSLIKLIFLHFRFFSPPCYTCGVPDLQLAQVLYFFFTPKLRCISS